MCNIIYMFNILFICKYISIHINVLYINIYMFLFKHIYNITIVKMFTYYCLYWYSSTSVAVKAKVSNIKKLP